MGTALNKIFEEGDRNKIVDILHSDIVNQDNFDGDDAYWYIKCVDCLLDGNFEVDDKMLSTIVEFFIWNINYDSMEAKYLECTKIVIPLLSKQKRYVEILNIMSPVVDSMDKLDEYVIAYYLISCINNNIQFLYVLKEPTDFLRYASKVSSKNLRDEITKSIEQIQNNDILSLLKQIKNIWVAGSKEDDGLVGDSTNIDIDSAVTNDHKITKNINKILLIGKSSLKANQIESMCSIFDIDPSLIEYAFSIDDINKYIVDNLYDNFRAIIIGPLPVEMMKQEDVTNNSVTKILNMSELPKNCYVCKELDVTSFKRAIKKLKL